MAWLQNNKRSLDPDQPEDLAAAAAAVCVCCTEAAWPQGLWRVQL
jgi:hypothetical protein